MYERTILTGLLQTCPYDSEAVNCPFKEVRRLPWEQRLAWADKLTASEVHTLVQQHYDEASQKELELLQEA
jgi:hypothetical protein